MRYQSTNQSINQPIKEIFLFCLAWCVLLEIRSVERSICPIAELRSICVTLGYRWLLSMNILRPTPLRFETTAHL